MKFTGFEFQNEEYGCAVVHTSSFFGIVKKSYYSRGRFQDLPYVWVNCATGEEIPKGTKISLRISHYANNEMHKAKVIVDNIVNKLTKGI